LNIEDLELMFNPVSRHQAGEDLRTAYEAALRDVIALDAAVIVSSGNIEVSPDLSPTSNDD